jgi:RNAse (barnase) inhibitor barstar
MTKHCIRLETKRITDRDSFFKEFSSLMGFPDFFGSNWDAWIDCMRSLDDASEGMTKITLPPGELLHIEIEEAEKFAKRVPEVFQQLIGCTAFVNKSRLEVGKQPVLSLILL